MSVVVTPVGDAFYSLPGILDKGSVFVHLDKILPDKRQMQFTLEGKPMTIQVSLTPAQLTSLTKYLAVQGRLSKQGEVISIQVMSI